jgi:type VI secretion system protein ImpG
MRDDLLLAYERELTYLRRLGAEFAKRYPGQASALQLDPTRSEDPHVERLLEGFAFLAARVHLRLDDDFAEIPQALLDSVYPEYARPVPSLALIQFRTDSENVKLSTGHTISAGTQLYSRVPVGGVQCRFRTCYDTTIWPITVKTAAWVTPHQLNPPVRGTEAVAALRIVFETPTDLPFSKLDMSSLRLYLNAEGTNAAALYELLSNNCEGILLRDGAAPERTPVALPPHALTPVGFEMDEGVLPVPRRSHIGFRLLSEYFAFPEKYYFFDLTGLERLRATDFGNTLEVICLIRQFERREARDGLARVVSADTIRLGCTPIINLFSQSSEPIRLSQRRADYQIVPDSRRRDAIFVYSVEGVSAVVGGRTDTVRFAPLYSYRHRPDATEQRFWHVTRRPRKWRADEGTDFFLSFVDAEGTLSHPDHDTATAQLLCHNGTLPKLIPTGNPTGDFDLRQGGPVWKTETLISPTPFVPARTDGALLWRLVSLLSLNYVSLFDDGPAALQQLLSLHNVREMDAARKQIQAISAVSSTPAHTRIRSDHGLVFARGHRVELTIDEDQFAGASVYLFASVLERFFGLYTSLNSFNVLRVHTPQRKDPLREWPPRAGARALV